MALRTDRSLLRCGISLLVFTGAFAEVQQQVVFSLFTVRPSTVNLRSAVCAVNAVCGLYQHNHVIHVRCEVLLHLEFFECRGC